MNIFTNAFSFLIVMGTLVFATNSSALDWYKVSDVAKFDATMGIEFLNDQVWISKNAESGKSHRIEIMDNEGKKIVQTINFPHSVSYIYPMNSSKVIIVGKAYTDQWYTYYSTVNISGGRYGVKTKRITPVFQINEFAEINGRKYFSEPGSRSVLIEEGSRIRSLPFEISFPSELLELNGNLWLLEKRGGGPGDEDLVRIDLKNNTISRLGNIRRNFGPFNLSKLSDGRLAMDDRIGGKFIVFDPRTEEIVDTVSLNHTPMSLKIYKNCAILPGGEDKKISVVRINDKNSNVVATFDLSGIEGEFYNSIRTAVNADKGILFVKSMAPCVVCAESRSAVYAINTPNLDWKTTCK
jgi:hypothetical protein